MGQGHLLDTNAVIDYLGGKFPKKEKIALDKIIDNGINISVINKIELLAFSKVEQDLMDFVNCAEVYMIDDNIVDRTIEIRKKYRTKLPDAVIAATAMQLGFALVTHNVKDFDKIEGLEVINPHRL